MKRRNLRLRFLLPLVILVAALLGSFLGAGLAVTRIDAVVSDEELFGANSTNADDSFPKLLPPEGPQPRVVVDQTEFDFGAVETGVLLRHAFTFKNVGRAPLEIRQGTTTCKCTISELEKQLIPPGGQAQVTLEWEVKGNLEEYRQVASIYTNDRTHRIVRLTVTGRRRASVAAYPNVLSFSGTQEDQPTLATRIYTTQPGSTITSAEIVNPAAADQFDVKWREIPLESAPLAAAEAAFEVLVTVKPGLPLGTVQQKIRVVTDVQGVAPLEIPLFGHIESDISISGIGWRKNGNRLDLGLVKSDQGVERELTLSVRGPHRDEVEFTVLSTDPEVLEAKLGEETSTAEGKVRRVPLVISVPPGCPPISRMGTQQSPFGEVRLKTNYPPNPELTIRVQFAVE